MDDLPITPDLEPVRRDDVLHSIQFAMTAGGRSRNNTPAREVAAALLADMVLEQFDRAGWIVVQRPPSSGHTTSGR